MKIKLKGFLVISVENGETKKKFAASRSEMRKLVSNLAENGASVKANDVNGFVVDINDETIAEEVLKQLDEVEE